MTSKHEWTESMTLHVTGRGFSELGFRVLCDGRDIGITRHKRTNGRPQYRIVLDEFRHKDDSFDNMKARGVGLYAWLDHRAKIAAGEGGGS